MERRLFSIFSRLRKPMSVCIAAGAGLFCSCFFSTDVPFQNNTPVVTSRLTADTMTILYPDSMVCTLQVDDLNDSIVTIDTSTWPGSSCELHPTLGPKQVALYLGTPVLGKVFSGTLMLRDQQDGWCGIPYTIRKLFVDSFYEATLDPAFWTVYDKLGDSAMIHQHSRRFGLEFLCKPQTDTLNRPIVLEMVSAYAIKGDFVWTIDYMLYWMRYNITPDSFELQFSSSNTSDTSYYSDEAAVSLNTYKRPDRLVIQYKDPSGENLGQNPGFMNEDYAGTMKFVRIADTITIFHKAEGADFTKVNKSPLIFNHADDSAYVHIRMTVTDHTIEQSCIFTSFTVQQGEVVY
jgi:hypothetical protein